MWGPRWDAFPAAHRTVRYDLRGFGRSPLPPQPYSHGRDLIALFERLRIEQATLVGASLGGRVALEVAVAHPQVVENRSILNTPPSVQAEPTVLLADLRCSARDLYRCGGGGWRPTIRR
jgi:pimeloyl-ACP methyl ester carboxylesterase